MKTFQKILASQPISLLKWFQENDPHVLENTRWVFGVKDYIRYRMTGEAFAELTDFSGSNLVNLKLSSYDREILTMLGLEEMWEKLPPLRISTDRCGYITKEAAELTGLAEGTPCAAGMFDIDACAIAMNITSDENIAVIAGTWGINEYISEEPVTNGSVMMNSLYCLPGFFLIEESSPTSAANHEWYINMFLKEEKDRCQKTGENIYALTDKLVESTSPNDSTIIFLPYLFGSNYDSRAKAGFIGIDSHHTQADIIRSVFEGIVFCHKVHLEKLLQNRPRAKAIRLSGGVCNSEVWVQIFADVLDMPIELIGIKELGAFGAALSAGVVCGCYKDLKTAAEELVKVDRTVYPIKDNVECYIKKYRLYKEVSNALGPLWKNF